MRIPTVIAAISMFATSGCKVAKAPEPLPDDYRRRVEAAEKYCRELDADVDVRSNARGINITGIIMTTLGGLGTAGGSVVLGDEASDADPSTSKMTAAGITAISSALVAGVGGYLIAFADSEEAATKVAQNELRGAAGGLDALKYDIAKSDGALPDERGVFDNVRSVADRCYEVADKRLEARGEAAATLTSKIASEVAKAARKAGDPEARAEAAEKLKSAQQEASDAKDKLETVTSNLQGIEAQFKAVCEARVGALGAGAPAAKTACATMWDGVKAKIGNAATAALPGDDD